jgi:hypothetical protein
MYTNASEARIPLIVWLKQYCLRSVWISIAFLLLNTRKEVVSSQSYPEQMRVKYSEREIIIRRLLP